MSERPIIFSGPMVVALIAGRKTMTRRIAWRWRDCVGLDGEDGLERLPSPWQKICEGDRLWIRENLRIVSDGIEYAADGEQIEETRAEWSGRAAEVWNHYAHDDGPDLHPTLVPSIHMPRWASRLTLDVVGVRCERLQDITEEDARAEGVDATIAGRSGWSEPLLTYRTGFVRVWNALHGEGAWLENPEVVVISFVRHSGGRT